MKLNMRGIYLWTFAVTAVLGIVLAQDCSEGRRYSCLEAFAGSSILVDISGPVDVDLPNWNETLDQLRDRCQRYTFYSQCMSTIIPACNDSYQDYLNGLAAGYTYLCKSEDQMKKLVGYQSCYQQNNVTKITDSFCANSYKDKLNNLPKTPEEKIATFCSITDIYLNCLTTAVTASCVPDAAAWQKQWNIEKRYQMMGVTFNCPGWKKSSGDSTTVWTIVLAVVLGLTTLIMIVGILIILVFINKKKKYHRRAGIPPPPPYTFGSFDDCPGPVVSADTTAPIPPALPADSSHSGDAATSPQSVSVNMRPSNKLPVKPPPYADQAAPAYESPSGASSPSPQGEINHGFQKAEGAKGGPEEEEEEEDIPPGPSEPGPAAGNVSESERELNSNWF